MEFESAEKRFKIGEVCRIADLQPYVLRYWETEFPPLAPNKSGGGQRLYTQREIDIILRIKQLLYSEGFTIAGAKKKLDGELNGDAAAPSPPIAASPRAMREPPAAAAAPSSSALDTVKDELREILALLKR
jgi:DNA-binding transcriptional MerR regulator